MPNPDFRSESGGDQNGTASATISFTGLVWQANDIICVLVATDGYVPTLSTANGFVIAQDPQGNSASITTNAGTPSTADCGLFLFWKRATGSTTAADPEPVIAAPVNGGTTWCLETNSYLGARTTGTPWHIITTGIVGTATATVAPPSVTPTLNSVLVMPCAGSANDDQAFNAWTLTGAASPTGQIDSGWHSGSGSACAFTAGRGGFATTGGARSGSTTFGATSKQAQFTLVMASLPEAVLLPQWEPRCPASTSRSSLATAALMSALVAPILPPSVVVPAMSWAPVTPNYQLRAARPPVNVGGMTMPDAVLPNADSPPLAWAPAIPTQQLRRAPAPVNVGGATAPEATLPNAPVPSLSSWDPVFPDTTLCLRLQPASGETSPTRLPSQPIVPIMSGWAPAYPDAVRAARAVVNVGGAVQPSAVIANPPAPGIAWAPVVPDLMPRPRCPQPTGLTAPPFAGGKRLTLGAMAARQNILSALAFSSPLTTFGTDTTFTAAAGTVLTATAHGMINTAGPFTLATTGTLPGGTDGTTLYYCAQPTANTFHLALSAANADASTFVTMTDGGTGTHTLVRTVNTAPLYSTFVSIIERGTQSSSPNLPTDSFGNTYAYVTGFPVFFASFPNSAVSVAVKLGGVGGAAHTWSTSIGDIGGSQDEVLASGLEIFDARILQASSVVERPDGGAAIITSNSVTTTARALLIAIINGNSNVGQENFWTFFDGFTKLPYISAEGDPSPSGYDQVCVAARYVDIPGTYTFRAQGTVRSGGGPSGGIMTLLAFQSQSSDLQPLDWLYPQADPPVRLKRVLQGGETAPPFVTAASVPPLPSWAPTSVDPVRARRTPASSSAEPINTDRPVPWLPTFPDQLARPVRQQPAASVAPPEQDPRTIGWLPTLPELARAPGRTRVADGETSPLLVPVASAPSLASWAPIFPDAVRRDRATWASGAAGSEVVLPSAPAPSLAAWAPMFPDAARGARTAPWASGTVGPEVALTNPPAPSIAGWLPSFPDAARRARVALTGGATGPEATLPNPPAPALSWTPILPIHQLRRAPGVVLVGGSFAPDAVIPNPPAPPQWYPIFPDAVARARAGQVGGEFAVIPGTIAPPVIPSLTKHVRIITGSGPAVLIVNNAPTVIIVEEPNV